MTARIFFLIWISNQRKIIRTRDITFNENFRYRFNEINLIQFINEFFLINDTLNISQNDFTKITNIELNSEKKLWNLAFIDFITHDHNVEKTNDVENIFEKAFEKTIDDVKFNYLFSSVSFSSKNENISNVFDSSSAQSKKTSTFARFFKIKKSKHWQRTTIDETNIQFEKIFRIRKSNTQQNFIYHIVLKNVFVEKINSFYETFTISMIKKKKLYQNNFLLEIKFYHQMFKHYNQNKHEKKFHDHMSKKQKKFRFLSHEYSNTNSTIKVIWSNTKFDYAFAKIFNKRSKTYTQLL